MAEAPRFEFRQRRVARIVLDLIGSPYKRLFFALIVAAAFGRPFANFTQDHQQAYRLSVLEHGPLTVYISRYVGIPDQEEFMEADPATLSSTSPKLDHFYRMIAARVKTLVPDPRTKYQSFVRGMGWSVRARGWPFVSRAGCYLVDVYEMERFDGRAPDYHTFFVDEYGLPPERPVGWWGNAAFGGILSGVVAFIILTLVAMGLQRSLRPVAGFPVIVADQSVIVPDQSTIRP